MSPWATTNHLRDSVLCKLVSKLKLSAVSPLALAVFASIAWYGFS